jgi:predicted PilT family ATPase
MAAFEPLTDIQNEIHELKGARVKFLAHFLKEEWLRTDQVMQILKIAPRTLSRRMHSNLLPYTKVGGIIYIKASDIEELLNKNHKPESSPGNQI